MGKVDKNRPGEGVPSGEMFQRDTQEHQDRRQKESDGDGRKLICEWAWELGRYT